MCFCTEFAFILCTGLQYNLYFKQSILEDTELKLQVTQNKCDSHTIYNFIFRYWAKPHYPMWGWTRFLPRSLQYPTHCNKCRYSQKGKLSAQAEVSLPGQEQSSSGHREFTLDAHHLSYTELKFKMLCVTHLIINERLIKQKM